VRPPPALGGQSGLRLSDHGLESAAFIHGEIGHGLAVELDAGQLDAVHELRIGQAFDADSRVDALDPQRAEGALLNVFLRRPR
jgi:hypothetical protein